MQRWPTRCLKWLSAVMALIAVLPAMAQDGAHAPEIVVTGKPPEILVVGRGDGPVRWKLTRGDSTVWVVPTMSWAPAGLAWDKTSLKRLFDRSKRFVRIDFIRRKNRRRSQSEAPPEKPLNDLLFGEQRTMFQRITTAANIPFDDVRAASAADAAGKLRSMILQRRGMIFNVQSPQLLSEAIERDLPHDTIAKVNVTGVEDEMDRLSAAGHDCIAAMFADTAYETGDGRARADAWARNDKKMFVGLFRPSKLLECWRGKSVTIGKLDEDHLIGMAEIIDKMLDRRGSYVVEVWDESWLKPNGLLERLRTNGVEIDRPAPARSE